MAKASVQTAEVKPMSGKAIASIRLTLTYFRDDVADSIEHNFSESYSIKNPLPSIDKLKAATYYVRYVPKEKRTEKIPNWVLVSSNEEFDGLYGRSSFGQMFTCILLGFMIKLFGKRKRVLAP